MLGLFLRLTGYFARFPGSVTGRPRQIRYREHTGAMTPFITPNCSAPVGPVVVYVFVPYFTLCNATRRELFLADGYVACQSLGLRLVEVASEEVSSRAIRLQPSLEHEKVVDLVRKNQDLDRHLFLPQTLHEVNRLAEGYIAVVVALN